MTKAIILIEDHDEEVHVSCSIEPALQQHQAVFNTVELIALYMRENMGQILNDAVNWSKAQ